MPTGYTAAVVDGEITELEPFVLQLARGMGALITMRDEPWDAPIPDVFEPSDYSAKRLREAQDRHAEILAMTESECQKAALVEYLQIKEDEKAYFAKKVTERERYKAMIAKVEAWEGAPEGIKEFALSQLRQGMDFDCPANSTYYKVAKNQTGAEWRAEQLAKCQREIERSSDAYAEEVDRATKQTAWVQQLKASLAMIAERNKRDAQD